MWTLTEERLRTIVKIKEAVELTVWKPGQGLWLRDNQEFGHAEFAIFVKHGGGWCVAIWIFRSGVQTKKWAR